ncbi:MAG: molybdopterin-dependent oxidoreductase [Chloroflexi bacterium]|nr:molybdopterin-dependent oxidoreductase [Chloroflexota bacterium]
MTTTFTRRDFLKLAGAAGAVALGTRFVAAKNGRAAAPSLASRAAGQASGNWIATACNMCGGQTGVLVRVDKGRVAKIEPNPDNPIGVANVSTDFWRWKNTDGAAMCPKGNAGPMALYDPDRVKTPLKRTNPEKGKGVDPGWAAISWDEALNTIAAKLRDLRDAGEAHKLVWFSEDHSFVDIQKDFTELYGTPNYHNHSNLCDVARKASFKLVVGDERPLGDFANARHILLFGWNPLSATKWSHLPRIFTRAIENGAKLVVVDPYLSQTAARAHEWIPLRPATDGALALALAHLLIKWNLYDQEFVNNWTTGFDDFAAFVADKTPEWAEQITDVPAATIRRMARDMANLRPAVVDVWSGPGQHSNAVQGGRAIAILNALLGNVDRPGGLINPERKGPARQKPHGPKIAQPRLDNLNLYPFGHGSGVYTEVLQSIVDGTAAYMPKIGMVIFQNLVLSVPGTDNVIEALKKLEFLVVVDTMLSETAEMADIVIPGTTYLERYDLTTNWVTWTSVSLRQPAVEPIFGQLPEYEFVVEVARRMGLKDADDKDFFTVGRISGQPVDSTQAWYEEYLSEQLLKGGPKISLDDLKALPGAVWIDPKGTRYEKFKDEVHLPDGAQTKTGYAIVKSADGKTILGFKDDRGAAHKPDGSALDVPADAKMDDKVQQIILDKDGKLWGYVDAKGILRGADGSGKGFLRDGKFLKGWSTPSRLIEFTSAQAAARKDRNGNAIDAQPVYTPRDWFPNADFPLYLINWKESSHTHSRTFNNPWLIELMGWNRLAINSETAARLGLKDGDEIWVESPYGKAKALARVTQGIHPEVVGWQHGFGHWGLGHIAKGKGTVDGMFNKTISDPISGMALHKEVCVKVYRV